MSTLTEGAGAPLGAPAAPAAVALGAGADGPPDAAEPPEAALAAGAAVVPPGAGGAPAAKEDAASGKMRAKTMNMGRRMRDFPFPKACCAPERIGQDAGSFVRPPTRGKAP